MMAHGLLMQSLCYTADAAVHALVQHAVRTLAASELLDCVRSSYVLQVPAGSAQHSTSLSCDHVEKHMTVPIVPSNAK